VVVLAVLWVSFDRMFELVVLLQASG